MANRRDQLFSYQLMMQRVISAFVYRDAELAQVPFRRGTTTMFLSAMVAAILLGSVAIFGLIVKGGNTSWRDPGVVIVEKETGARFVYLDGRLHQVVNYASARLILKQRDPKTVLVSTASLVGAPRGALLGIVGAPDSLPPTEQLLTGPWTVCSQSETDAASDRAVRRSVLFVGQRPAGVGRPPADDAMLVRQADGSVFLVWHDGRFRIRDPGTLLNALALGQAPITPVAAALVNAIPPGPDIARITIPGRGATAPLPNARVGQVLKTKLVTGGEEYYVALADGIASITAVQADILLQDPATAAAYPRASPQPLERTDLSTARKSGTRLLPADDGPRPPASPPAIARLDANSSGLCVSSSGGGAAAVVTIDAALPPLQPPTASVVRTENDPVFADRVLVSPGAGVLAQSDPGGGLSIVTDLGVRYPLSAPEVAGYLGYDLTSAVRMPANLVSLIPLGRPLDPSMAGRPVPVG